MAILKIKETQINAADPLLREDPFELFTLEQYDPPRPHAVNIPSPLPAKSFRQRWVPGRWAGLLFSTAIAVAAGMTTWHLLRTEAPDAEKPYAYFEIRVIDANGHPVAGAVVRNGGRKVGTTDSFGEWRRYMKVTLGSTVSLGFNKKTTHESLAAIKNFAVPATLPEEKDLGIKGTVQVLREAEFLAVNDLPAAAGQRVQPPTGNPTPAEIIAASSPAQKISNEYSAVSISADPTSVDTPATDAVAEAMRKRAGELGLAVTADARWKVTVKGLQSKPGQTASGGLFMVRSSAGDASVSGANIDGADKNVAKFLRNFESDPMTSARGALWILSMHIPKDFPVSGRPGSWTVGESTSARALFPLAPGKTLVSSTGRIFTVSNEAIMVGAKKSFVLNPPDIKPCAEDTSICSLYSPGIAAVPPLAAWQRLQLRAVGLQRPDTEIFVSGYAATPVGRDVWEFWGGAGLPANVTVVVDGRLTHRTKITPKSGAAVQLFVPAMGVSRR